jgi:hypothetical protein
MSINKQNKQNNQNQNSTRPITRPIPRPRLVEHSGAMFLDGIRIYSLDLDGQLQKSIDEYKLIGSTKPKQTKTNQFDHLNDIKNKESSWSSFFETQLVNIHMFFSNTYESIYLKLFGNYHEISTSDDEFEDYDEFEM